MFCLPVAFEVYVDFALSALEKACPIRQIRKVRVEFEGGIDFAEERVDKKLSKLFAYMMLPCL